MCVCWPNIVETHFADWEGEGPVGLRPISAIPLLLPGLIRRIRWAK